MDISQGSIAMFLSFGVLVIHHKALQCRKHWALSQAHMKPDALRTDVSGKVTQQNSLNIILYLITPFGKS